MTNLQTLRKALSKIRPTEVEDIIERFLKERQLDKGSIEYYANDKWVNSIALKKASQIILYDLNWNTVKESEDFWGKIHDELQSINQ